MGASRIVRGILIGGSVGAFSVFFGFAKSLFVAVGIGMAAGFLAGMTMQIVDKKREKNSSKK